NFQLDGNASTIVPAINWRDTNERNSSLIDIVGVENTQISNLTIDNMARRGVKGMPSTSVLITNSNHISISDVHFKDLGIHIREKEVGGSPFILIVAQEEPEDFSYLPNSHKDIIGSVSDIEIKN